MVVGGAQIHLSVFSHLDSKEEEEPEDLVLQQVVLCLCSLTVVDVQWCRRSRRRRRRLTSRLKPVVMVFGHFLFVSMTQRRLHETVETLSLPSN